MKQEPAPRGVGIQVLQGLEDVKETVVLPSNLCLTKLADSVVTVQCMLNSPVTIEVGRNSTINPLVVLNSSLPGELA